MITSFYQALFSSGNNELLLNFKAGYFTGVSLCLALLLLWVVVKLVYLRKAKRRLREMVIPGVKGDLIISVSAITDMVKLVVYEKFKHVSIDKVAIWKTPRGLGMELRGVYKLDGDHLPDVTTAMREEIFKNLEEKLGIHSIKKINCGI